MRHAFIAAVAVSLLGLSSTVSAQSAWVAKKGTVEGDVGYQLVLTDGNYGNLTENGTLSFEGLESYQVHNIFLGASYSITDRLQISASMPFTNVKFTGDPDFLPHGPEDGNHNTYHHLTDLTLYVQYMFPLSDNWTVTPLLGFNTPTTDYNTVGHGIVGLGRRDIRPGVAVGFVASRFLSQLVVFHQFMEKVGPYERFENDRSNVALTLGYFVTDRFTASLSGMYRHTWKGTSFKDLGPIVEKLTADPAVPLSPEEQAIFDFHDPNVQERGMIGRLGVTYRVSDNINVDASYLRTLFGDSMQAAQGLSISFAFLFDTAGTPKASGSSQPASETVAKR